MTGKTTLSAYGFSEAFELIVAIEAALADVEGLGQSRHGVYIHAAQEFHISGVAILREEVLTDGSRVFDIELSAL
jgi:hypothetical protein